MRGDNRCIRCSRTAGIPMTDLVVSVASGKVNGVVVCDLNKEEELRRSGPPHGHPSEQRRTCIPTDGRRSLSRGFQDSMDYNMEA